MEKEMKAKTELSRREFMRLTMTTAGVVVSLPLQARAQALASDPAKPASAPNEVAPTMPVNFRINGESRRLTVDTRTTLLDTLRENLALTGTKKGCDHGQCGACTVLVNGKRLNSCLALAVMYDGAEITTVEGLARGEDLHPLQVAFLKHDAFQCGYCTSGQLCSAAGLLAEGHAKTDADIREQMSGNICRCGAYPNIVAAVREVHDHA